MTRLGKFIKQPREVEMYAIQFAEDMSESDSLSAAYGALSLQRGMAGERVQDGPYAAQLQDYGWLLYANASITLPEAVPDGYVLMVSNVDQDAALLVGPFPLAARGAMIVRRQAGAWQVEMSATCIIVAAGRDQRVRMVVAGGVDGASYKGQITATTAEGRTMEDEMLIRVKES